MEEGCPDLTLFRSLSGLDIPEIITKDNINIPIGRGKKLLINHAFEFGNLSIILYFKSLGAKLDDFSAYHICNIEGAMVFFEMGGENLDKFPLAYMVMMDRKELVYFLIDYGIKQTNDCFWDDENSTEFNNYISTQIVPRTTASRKALVALMILRKEAFFRASRDVVVTVAREMWAQKGPADKCCGPRSALWAKKPL